MRKDGGNFGDWAAQFYDGWMSAAGEELAATVAATAGDRAQRDDAGQRVHGALWGAQAQPGAGALVVDECGAGGKRAEMNARALCRHDRGGRCAGAGGQPDGGAGRGRRTHATRN